MKKSNIEVSLVDYMGNDLSVVNAARVSFFSESSYDENGELENRDKSLIRYLAENNHWTPFAHAVVKLRIKMPFFVWNQLRKHQTGAVNNEISRRYVQSEPEFYFPQKYRKSVANVKQGSSQTEFVDISEMMVRGVVESCLTCYNTLLEQGVCAEQARMFLPLNTMTEIIWTGSLAFWARVCEQRLDPHAQYETRVVAKKIYHIMSDLFPNSWAELMRDVDITKTKE